MSSRLLRNILEMIEAEEAAKGSKSNHGTESSFNNQGNGHQNFSGAKINGGAYSGDRNRYHTSNDINGRNINNGGAYSGDGNRYHSTNDYNGRAINNSGTFNGHGNGGFIDGNFDASTRNYNY